MADALLNPPIEAAVCRKMLEQTSTRLRGYEKEVTGVVLDRERYLLIMGKISALKELHRELETIYAREFET